MPLQQELRYRIASGHPLWASPQGHKNMFEEQEFLKTASCRSATLPSGPLHKNNLDPFSLLYDLTPKFLRFFRTVQVQSWQLNYTTSKNHSYSK